MQINQIIKDAFNPKAYLSTLASNATVGACGSSLGALLLPYYAHQFVGGLGMIAATAVVSNCFAVAIVLGLNLVFIGLPLLIKYKLDIGAMTKDCLLYAEKNPEKSLALWGSFSVLSVLASAILGPLLASMVMGQPLMPLFICSIVGNLALISAFYLISSLTPKSEYQAEIASPAY